MHPFTAQTLADIVLADAWSAAYSPARVDLKPSRDGASHVDASRLLSPTRLPLELERADSPTKSLGSPRTPRPLRSYAVEFRIEYDDLDIRDKIGAGGYGSVFKAVWKTGHVYCAVKMLKQGGATDHDSDDSLQDSDAEGSDGLVIGTPRDDFERETALLRELHHPNLVLCYGMCPGGPGLP